MTVKNKTNPGGRTKKWADIFADTDNFADDMNIAIKQADGTEITYSLGDLRQYNEDHEGSLLANLESREKAVKADAANVEAAKRELLSTYEEIQRGAGNPGGRAVARAAAGKKVTAADLAEDTGLDETDPIVGSLVKEINNLKANQKTESDGLKGTVVQLQNVIKNVLGTYLEDSYQTQFAGLQSDINKLPEKVRKTYTYDELKKHAEENKLMDKAGRLDLRKAFRERAADQLKDVEFEERLTKAKKDWENEARMANVQHPRRAGSTITQPEFDVSKSKDPIGDAINLAMKDDELWNGIMGQQQ